MKAMILAAGGGTRLYPLTFTLPKPMAPIINRPAMEHIISHLLEHGISEIVVNLHNLPEHIEDYFGDGSKFGVNITYSREDEPLGTAGGVKKVADLFDSTFLVIGGDDLHDLDIDKQIEFHKKNKAIATIGLSHEEDVHMYGVVVTDKDGRIVEFQEKPDKETAKSHWVNNGIYIFEPEILDYIPENNFYDFGSQLFPLLKDKGAPFYGFKCEGYWKDIGNLSEYRLAHFDCLHGKVKVNMPGKEIMPGVWAEEDVEIPDDIEIKAPVLIGKQCKFGKGVRIEGPLVIGKFNVIEDGVNLTRSVLWDYNHLKKNVRVKDCLVGSECIIEEDRVYEETVIGSGLKHVFEDYFQRKRMSKA